MPSPVSGRQSHNDTPPALDQEVREIEDKIRRSEYWDTLELISKCASSHGCFAEQYRFHALEVLTADPAFRLLPARMHTEKLVDAERR